MSLKLEAVPVSAELLTIHERAGGGELEMYAVARPKGYLRLTVADESAGKEGGRRTHITVSFAAKTDPATLPSRRPNDKELREILAHFAYMGTFEEDNSLTEAGGLVRHLWSAE
ncbi:MAG: hypothetical protein NT069_01415 [Planctomycetota bacterium]|nr:hypothetical protein [Planctomycetota bacterium]